jgi:drug/metabolite transporter superfamily protein YnfA
MTKSKILITLFFFFLAGLFEIGGGYLVWVWLRESTSWIVGALGDFVLYLYIYTQLSSHHTFIGFIQHMEDSLFCHL